VMGSKFQLDRCAGSKRELKRETDSPSKQWGPCVLSGCPKIYA
jgi:hypothetical protein